MMKSDASEMVIRAFTLFDFLQCIDEADERDDADVRRIVDDYFVQRYPDMPSMRSALTPFVNLKTTMTLLIMPICYAAKQPASTWERVGWKISDRYDIEFHPCSDGAATPVDGILSTIRNAIAHSSDFIFDSSDKNISWGDEYTIKFTSFRPSGVLRNSVTFRTENGLREFLSDFIMYTKRAMRSRDV